MIAALPGPTTIVCPATPVFAVATASDACGSAFTLTFAEVTTVGACAGSYSVTRTWTATDACNNISTASQTINVQDLTAPVIVCPPALVQCGGNAPPPAQDSAAFVALGGTVSDNCGHVSVIFVNDAASGVSPKVITRTYRATDSCGNSQDCSQTITIKSLPVANISYTGGSYCASGAARR